MKLSTLIILFFAGIFTITSASAQNVSINLLTQNGGLVALDGFVFLQVDINNTDPTISTPIYKLRPQISVPASIAIFTTTGHVLPPGWAVIFNSGTVLRLTNGTDQIPPNESRIILLRIQGTALGGPETVPGNLQFSNGQAPGTVSGGGTPGDNPADNVSQSTIEVVVVTPVTLTDFTATLVNCQPQLNWITETEVNSDRFEIERGSLTNSNWTSVGVVTAKGNTTTKSKYNFLDANLNASSERVLYRLKMIDKDGKYKYSKVLPVFVNCKTTQVFVYPNPVQNGKLYVSVTGASGYTEASLMSVSGQVILRNKLSNGTNNLSISNIADGVYILNVKDAKGLDKKVKVLIQN